MTKTENNNDKIRIFFFQLMHIVFKNTSSLRKETFAFIYVYIC